MLFVDHRQGQPPEPDLILEKGVGAHGDRRRTGRQGLELFPAARTPVPSGQEQDADPLGLEWPGEGLEVLPGEDFRGSHERALGPGCGGVGEGQHGHHGLSRTDIALEEPAHPLAGSEVAADLCQGGALVRGQAEGQGGLDHVRKA